MTPKPAAFDLDGRVAVVTGGSAGIGLGIARTLGAAGATVAIWARDEDRLARATESLTQDGIATVPARCDVTVEDDVERAMETTIGAAGPPDVLVANAGLQSTRVPFVDTSVELWERSLRGNLTSAFICFRAAARQMIARGSGGSLIAVSSAAALQASPLIHQYAAAKAGLHALVRAVAHELAPAGIRCNALVPGFTESERLVAADLTDQKRAVSLASIPAGRFGLPEDLGMAALYLADPALRYQTGGMLVVDGGLSTMAAHNAAAAGWDASRRAGTG
ncbi:MAG TPA: SDR family oxidoreductase [Acidimicrobiales bacterium]|nr:SDR family oxidoreductase [Acidimicrobiales bacterium]